jgi:hypothetical protein
MALPRCVTGVQLAERCTPRSGSVQALCALKEKGVLDEVWGRHPIHNTTMGRDPCALASRRQKAWALNRNACGCVFATSC